MKVGRFFSVLAKNTVAVVHVDKKRAGNCDSAMMTMRLRPLGPESDAVW